MNTPLLPTAYLPPISYFALLAKEEQVVVEQWETYPKQTYRNRAVILTANGPMTLSVPAVRTHGNHTMTHDVGISYAENWNVQHWRAIQSAYNSSPFFLYYKDGLEKILLSPQKSILQLNALLLEFLMKKLKLATQVAYSMDYTPATGEEWDYRAKFSPKHPSTTLAEYPQVFADRMPFVADLSIIDLLFNLGPDARGYLLSIG